MKVDKSDIAIKGLGVLFILTAIGISFNPPGAVHFLAVIMLVIGWELVSNV